MHNGSIIQTATPEQLYEAPASRYVADFVGKSNFIDGTVVALSATGGQIETASGQQFQGRISGALAQGAKAALSAFDHLIRQPAPAEAVPA